MAWGHNLQHMLPFGATTKVVRPSTLIFLAPAQIVEPRPDILAQDGPGALLGPEKGTPKTAFVEGSVPREVFQYLLEGGFSTLPRNLLVVPIPPAISPQETALHGFCPDLQKTQGPLVPWCAAC